ncbi:leucyl aminopeptidase [Glaciibacter psychrotolerans]|uniref:Probable cytosol aminopeptidase n=1 Tax=Glaciibacter psychrotolerans TaxID=670054 RepID=A0A7Z0EH90_9MICO|nr:leucyl aminopeptidase [Leifsonia psychrotolerans]NYJ21642.1 leucyl aminopeptidase [Leifsonia psychrotolerans]
MTPSDYKLIPSAFSATPSLDAAGSTTVTAATQPGATLGALGYFVGTTGVVPNGLGVDRDALTRAGFDGAVGQTLILPQPSGPELIAVGAGKADEQNAATLRDAAAAFARAARRAPDIGLIPGEEFALAPDRLGQLITEGVLLARYRYAELKPTSKHSALTSLELIVPDGQVADVAAGIRTGEILAQSANLARDLANTPPSHLTATDFGDVAARLGAAAGLAVEIFDKKQITELGLGGLLGVNAGSIEEPRMIKIVYTPAEASSPAPAHLALVGKGIMYDSGGISLKPSDPMHLAMKMDMAGAGAVLATMIALRALDCPNAVTAFLMCTDNMPSGSAMKLGDVLTIRGGTTVEVKNTDAEGRLVLSDGIVLAGEESPDAIVDIATLTGAALMAFGQRTAAVLGNNQELILQAMSASEATDESIWQLPLERRYRDQLNSDVADMSNMGGKYAGATLAALFLADFVGETPWVHFDIASTMQSDSDDLWRSKGATGFGTRLLIDLACNFVPVK